MLEHGLVDAIRPTESGPILAADPETTERVMSSITQAVRDVEQTGRRPVLVCSAGLRSPLRRLLRTVDPDLAVMSYAELDRTVQVDAIGVIDLSPTALAQTAGSASEPTRSPPATRDPHTRG